MRVVYAHNVINFFWHAINQNIIISAGLNYGIDHTFLPVCMKSNDLAYGEFVPNILKTHYAVPFQGTQI